jgi:hypothetical protein
MSLTTRGLRLEKAVYKVFIAETFGNAILLLMHHQIDLRVLCPSLREDRRGDLIQGLPGSSALLNAVGRLLTQKVSKQIM